MAPSKLDTNISPQEIDFATLIQQHTMNAGIPFTPDQARLCALHVQLMLEWNTRFNLTRITDPEEIVVKHLLDSIAPATSLPSSGPALDIGTGAGFPGIPLKIFYQDLDMCLLDARRKKVGFLEAVIANLGLQGHRASHGRWEEFARAPENRNLFCLITMRAVKLEPNYLSLAVPTLALGGVFAWWSGPESESAAEDLMKKALPAGLEFAGKIPYSLPGIERPRSVWTWEKTGEE